MAPSLERIFLRVREMLENEATLMVEFELALFAARDGSLATVLNAWQNAMTDDLARVLRTLECDSPADAAHAVIHLMRGYEHEQQTNNFKINI